MLRFRHIKKRELFDRGLGDRSWCELSRGGVDRWKKIGREFRPEGKSVLYGRCSANNWINPALGSPLTKLLDPPLLLFTDQSLTFFTKQSEKCKKWNCGASYGANDVFRFAFRRR